MNHGLTCRRISSGEAGVSPDTLGIILIASAPFAPALFRGFGLGRLFRPRRQRGFAADDEHVAAAVEACERTAGDPREHLAGVAVDVDHLATASPAG